MNKLGWLLAVTTLALGACAMDSSSDTSEADATDGEATEMFDMAADGAARPLGTFRATDGVAPGELTTLLVKRDGTWTSQTLVACITTPCNPVTASGTFRLTRRSSHKYLYLDAPEAASLRFEYWLRENGTLLVLRKIGERATSELRRDIAEPAFCLAAEDCGAAQGAPSPRCPGRWTCGEENACVYECGFAPGPVAPQPPECRAVGTRSEGWYKADGTLMCWTHCGGHVATCRNAGTRSEGWYTDAGFACGASDLLGWTDCDPTR